MNIFFLAPSPEEAATYHCDKHVVKMVLESAQMLSTAHRLLDGVKQTLTAPNGKKHHVYLLEGETAELKETVEAETEKVKYKLEIERRVCYNATHSGHPCSVWVMQSASNYKWLYQLMIELDRERQHRFTPKVGKTIIELGEFLAKPPNMLPDLGMTPPARAMPDPCKLEDPVDAYRLYYNAHKQHIASWTKRLEPSWFQRRTS